MKEKLSGYIEYILGVISVYIAIAPWILGIFTLMDVLLFNIQMTAVTLAGILIISGIVELILILYLNNWGDNE